MSELEWERNFMSQELTALGDKGQYGIHEVDDQNIQLLLVTHDYAGVNMVTLTKAKSIDECKEFAEKYEATK